MNFGLHQLSIKAKFGQQSIAKGAHQWLCNFLTNICHSRTTYTVFVRLTFK